MHSQTNDFEPNLTKLYEIQYQDKNHRHVHNAIFGRTSKPYRFRFCKVKEDHYLLVRHKDGQVLCFDDKSLGLNFMNHPIHIVMVKPIKVEEFTYALQVQNQSVVEEYIYYDGYVLHEYYIAVGEVDSLENAAIWSITEVPSINVSPLKYPQFVWN